MDIDISIYRIIDLYQYRFNRCRSRSRYIKPSDVMDRLIYGIYKYIQYLDRYYINIYLYIDSYKYLYLYIMHRTPVISGKKGLIFDNDRRHSIHYPAYCTANCHN